MDLLQDPIQKQVLFNGTNTVHDGSVTGIIYKDGVKTEVKTLPGSEVQKEGTEKPRFEIEEHPVDEVRDITVGVIGAGLAGITTAVLLPAKLPGLRLRIYEKNGDVVR
jgi:hypothetical protein